MNWRSNWIWLTIFIGCMLSLYIFTQFAPKETFRLPDLAFKGLPLQPFVIQPKTDYVDIGLKIGGGIGGIMSLINLIEKIGKIVRRKREE